MLPANPSARSSINPILDQNGRVATPANGTSERPPRGVEFERLPPVQTAWDTGAVIGGVVHLGWTQDGKHQQRWIRIAHVWAKRDGTWRMTYTQVTRLP
ncbi:hypothetical protein FHW12_000581 [Dokdonella fugitiva]|uniref:DUF4440 domain-containing protein n=1 Tax=Dokdonella fugitiva TaxID=328517 RepID=A0A839EZR2_9GAMM|nr:hypothetical protein [Dokdonella fugitiva]MBA8886390.1 hypothetical protein [Dokdonella fugitiva]